MKIKLLVEGGNMTPGPTIGQKLGPVGINIGQVIQEVNKATQNFKGIKIPVILDIDTKTKQFKVEVGSPPVSELLKKEAGIEKGSGEQDKIKVANLSIEQIISIAKSKLQGLLDKDLKSAVKTVVGSCVSLGILIENKPAKEIEKEIDNGTYDEEIQKEKTETSPEKRRKLDSFFSKLEKKQEEIIKKEEEEKAAEEAKKAEEAEAEGEEKPEGEEKAAEGKEVAQSEEAEKEEKSEEK